MISASHSSAASATSEVSPRKASKASSGSRKKKAESKQPKPIPRDLVPAGVLCERLSVHSTTLIFWERQGKIRSYRSGPRSHRRYSLSDTLIRLGYEELLEDEEKNREKGSSSSVIIYARVSTSKQSKEGGEDNSSDLTRQIDRCKEYSTKFLGCHQPTIFSDTGSGLSYTRPGFSRLLKDILAGKCDGCTLLLNYKERLVRFGFEMFQAVADAHNIKIKIVDGSDNSQSESEELAADLLAVTTCFSSKLYSRRQANRRRTNLEPETIKQILELSAEGLTLKEIAGELDRRGVTGYREDGTRVKISFHPVMRTLNQREKLMEQLGLGRIVSSVEQYFNDKVKGKFKEIKAADFLDGYRAWCKRKKVRGAKTNNVRAATSALPIRRRKARRGGRWITIYEVLA